jgi:hypothetical protein
MAEAAMEKLKINYVQGLPRSTEDLPPDVVEVYVGVSGKKVDLIIRRQGFILAEPAMNVITERIKQLAIATAEINRPVVERIGLSPAPNADWRKFLHDLLERNDSWAFVVTAVGKGSAS